MGAYGRVHPYQFLPALEKERVRAGFSSRLVWRSSRRDLSFALSGGQKQRMLIARALMVIRRSWF